MALRAAAVMRALVATNALLAMVVVLLLRRLRRKASLNAFIHEVGHATNSSSWTLKLVWSSGSNRKELSLASSGTLTSSDAAEKLDIAVKSKQGMEIRGRMTSVDVDHFSGYVCLNCQLFRRSAIGGWSCMPVLNAVRHHISLFNFRGYVGIAEMDAVKSDLEQLLGPHVPFTIGKPLAQHGLPGFQTAMAVDFLDGNILDDLHAYAQANAHRISWYNSTSGGNKIHICL